MTRHRAIAGIEICAGRLNALHDRLADLHGGVAKLPLDAVGPIVPRTPFDRFHRGSRNQLQHVACLESDILHPQVAGNVIRDPAERARKIGGTTIRSVIDISKHQRVKDNNDESVAPKEMLAELSADNQALTRYFRSAHETCNKHDDVATASVIEVWIDQTERRTWFLAAIVAGL